MRTDTIEDGLSRRLAALSPGRRAMLQRLIQANAADTSPVHEIPLQPRTGKREFPLSAAQERMWFNHQWSPDQPLYNESFGLIIHGALNTNLLERSFDLLMARHEIFTVTFHSSEEGFFQRIGGACIPRMEIRDLLLIKESEREAAYEAESQRLLRAPFRLERGPLFRAGLWITGEAEYRLIFAMHHIIFDGWSGGIFLRELLTAYNSEARLPALPALEAQYVDFAVWEQSQAQESAAVLDRQLDYWKKQLDGVQAPELPFDRRLPDGEVHSAGREVFLCNPAATEALKLLAKEAGATLSMALLSTFKLLLARYSGQDDIVVGIPTTNRSRSELRDMIGVFINTAILRTDFSGDPTFRELLGRVRKTTLDAQANQEVPLQRVVRHLNLEGHSTVSLLRVLFDLQKKPGWLFTSPGLSIEPMETGNGLAKFDIVLAMEDTGEELRGMFDYDAEKFEAATARQLVRHYLALIDSAVAQPDVPVSKLAMLTNEDLNRAEARGLDTSNQIHPFACAEAMARIREKPKALALADAQVELTYGQLGARAARMAAYLRRHEVGPGQHIALFLPAGLDFVTAQLAVMMTGAAFVPVDPAYPQARIEFMLRDCEARFVIVNGQSPAALPKSIIPIQPDRDCPPLASSDFVSAPPQISSDPAYVIYTSGSTGNPKGVSVSYAALANLIAWHRRVFEISSRDRATQMASVAFDASIWEIWPYLSSGASLHFPPRDLIANPAGMRDWLVKNSITIGFAPTYLAEEMIALRWPSAAKLRCLLTGGDLLRKTPPADLPFQFVNNYGPTENTVVATSGVVRSFANGTAPAIGRPIDNVWAKVVDRGLQPVPQGGTGELILGGRSLATGYWSQPELTSEKFVTLAGGERAYRTGDLCRFRRDGEIEFRGRMDTQVKLRGCRIELGEIESALLAHEGLREAAAEIRELSSENRSIVAYIVPKSQDLSNEKLRMFLGSRLPGYMMPSSFVRIDSLPKTPNGKIDRKKLTWSGTETQPDKRQVASFTATQAEIAALWRALLKIESVAATDNFFELGGDSLLATRLATAIRDKFAVELPLAGMMRAPTLEALAGLVESAHPHTEKLPDGVIPLRSPERGQYQPPLFLTPPASGSPACYASLAGALTRDRAVYGFEAVGLTRGRAIPSVVEQARRYIVALEAIYPHGPCFIAGWSLGGPVAFEMACQLREKGREVGYLGMIDAGLPEGGRLPGGASMLTPFWWAISYPFVEDIPLNYQTIRLLSQWMGIPLPESLRDIWRRGPKAGSRFAAELLANGWRCLRVFVANLQGFRNYQPRCFDGEVTLFRTAQGGELDNGRDALVKNIRRWSRHVDVHEAPGSHMTLMLDAKLTTAFAPFFDATLNVLHE